MRGRPINEHRLAQQAEALLREEQKLYERRADVLAREERVDHKARELERRIREHERWLEQQLGRLKQRAANVTEREAEVERRMMVLEDTARKRAAQLAQEAASLGARAQEVYMREAAVAHATGNAPSLPQPPPAVTSPADTDSDGVPDLVDACPAVPDPAQSNSDALIDNGPTYARLDRTVPHSDRSSTQSAMPVR